MSNRQTLILKDLLPGFYQVSLTAEDSAGNNKTGNVAFHIAPLMIPDGGTPVLDGNCGDTAYQDAAKVVIPLTSGGQAEVRLVHSGNHMYACFSDLEKGIPDDLGLFAPTVAGLQIDAVGDGTVDDGWLDDRGFFVDENGLPFQRVGSSGRWSGSSRRLAESYHRLFGRQGKLRP